MPYWPYMTSTKSAAAAFAVLLLPTITFAKTLNEIGDQLIGLINTLLVPLLFAVAFIVFIYGIAKTYIFSHGDSEAVGEGHKLILWGLIGFFVMVSVWGLVNILTGTISFSNNAGPTGGIPSAGVQVGP